VKRGLVIRRFQPEDRELVWRLHVTAFAAAGTPSKDGPWNDDFADIEGIYLHNQGEYLVGLLDGTIVAMGALRRVNDDTAEVKRMRVHPQHWRCGYGQAIYSRLEERARELGYSKLVLDTTEPLKAAQAFYVKNGFRQCGRRQAGPFQLILFEKELGKELDRTADSSRSLP
jgi:GNAT superfamily N-acetyltransferase